MSDQATNARLTSLWDATDRLLEGATLAGILVHKLGPLAANRLRRLGEPVPQPLALEERAARLSMLTGVPLVQRIRESCDGQLILIKGPEVASLYPGEARRFGDIDLLSDNAATVQKSLICSGFLEAPDPDFDVTPQHHHLQPLRWPTNLLKVEVHKDPNWPKRTHSPLAEILDACIPSALQIDGVRAPAPLHHALILASHAWEQRPLQTLRDLIDIVVVSADVDERELDRTARAWGVGRIWRTTQRAIDAIFHGGRSTVPLRSWAKHLELVRERTVLERHLALLFQGYWGMPPHSASAETLRALSHVLVPSQGETWRNKLTRTRRAIRNPRAPAERRDLHE